MLLLAYYHASTKYFLEILNWCSHNYQKPGQNFKKLGSAIVRANKIAKICNKFELLT